MAVFFTRRGSAPSLGTRLGDLEIGTIVHIKENGVYQDYLVVHQGLPGSMYDSSCNGTWILRKDIIMEYAWNRGGDNLYSSSIINTYLNSSFLSIIDGGIAGYIKSVKIPYVSKVSGAYGSVVSSGSSGLSCKVFLLSGYEIGLTKAYSNKLAEEGAKLSFFLQGAGVEAEKKRIAEMNGVSSDWWLRSPDLSYIKWIWCIGSSGKASDAIDYDNIRGVRPAFILPPDLLVDDNNNILV